MRYIWPSSVPLGAECKFKIYGNDNNTLTSTQTSYYEKKYTNITLEAGKFYRNVNLSIERIITGTIKSTFTIGDGCKVILKDANISVSSGSGIKCLGNATIILEGENTITAKDAGIQAGPANTTLTIKGSGSLTATGGDVGAGIGGTANTSCGSIVIEGGNITANGSGGCAGIGSGHAYSGDITCGDITISGGTVTAMGGVLAAGIGSGHANQASNTCGNITISGGTVTATGGKWAAGIGSGHANQASNTCGNILISGGTVTATGGTYSAGIGSGGYGKYTSISISSGISDVTATSGGEDYAPIGIGAFDQGSGTVTIDGTVIDGGTGYSPHNWNPSSLNLPNTTANGNLNWSLSGNTWTLTPKP